MCGRYKRRSDKQRIAEAFAVGAGLDELYDDPSDDIAPGSLQPVIRLSERGERQIELMRWAFKMPTKLLFNARAEGIDSSKFWAAPFLKGRCIIPADAFFEWQEVPGSKQKKPKYEFTVPGREQFAMAGLWKLWQNPKTQQWEPTFAVITGPPNELMAPIHDRMAVILQPRDYAEYLAEAERPPIHLLRTIPAEEMQARLVSADPITNEQVRLFDSQ